MASLSSEEACNSLPPATVDYTPTGSWMETGLKGLKTYSSIAKSHTSPKTAIVFLYDIGGFCDQNYQAADILATQGWDVYIPDAMHGKYLDLKNFMGMSDEEKAKKRAELSSGFPGSVDSQPPKIAEIISELKGKGYEKVAGIGFCWGGSVVSLTPEFDAHVICHPGRQVDAPAAVKLTNPTCLLPSGNEDEAKMEAFHAEMLKKPVGDKCVLKFYKDMQHGWCAARGDLKDEKVRAGFQDAFQTIANFLKNVL